MFVASQAAICIKHELASQCGTTIAVVCILYYGPVGHSEI